MPGMTNATLLGLAQCAARLSVDPSLHVGAIIELDCPLGNRPVLVEGWNHFPLGVDRRPERTVRPAKYLYTEHAERAAIYTAVLNGQSTKNSVMACTHWPCADCARAIIMSGVVRLIIPKDGIVPTFNDSSLTARVMLKECGVEVVEL